MLVTPPPCGHPLYKQRGSLQSTHNKHIKNNPYIELTLILNELPITDDYLGSIQDGSQQKSYLCQLSQEKSLHFRSSESTFSGQDEIKFTDYWLPITSVCIGHWPLPPMVINALRGVLSEVKVIR